MAPFLFLMPEHDIAMPSAPMQIPPRNPFPRDPSDPSHAVPASTAWALLALLCVASGPGQAQSVERGRAVYQAQCSSCHSPDTNGDGPAHAGVVGRRAGALKDFDYSPALRNSKLLWTRATLKAWLADPEALIPGQGMDVSLDDARDREDVVAYLATLKRLR